MFTTHDCRRICPCPPVILIPLQTLPSTTHAQAIRDMTDGAVEASNIDQSTGNQQARAAQVLAAVVSGLTSTPQDLSSKHRANRSAAGSSGEAGAAGGPGVAAPAKPALQKIRDYQLQVGMLVCSSEKSWLLERFCTSIEIECCWRSLVSKRREGLGLGYAGLGGQWVIVTRFISPRLVGELRRVLWRVSSGMIYCTRSSAVKMEPHIC